MFIVGGASIATAADGDLSVAVSAAPSSGAYAVAGQDSWVIHMIVTDQDGPAELSDADDLEVTGSSESVNVSPIGNPGLGTYSAQVSSDDPGVYPLSVTLNGREVAGATVQFFSSGPDPSRSELTTVGSASTAACGAPVQVSASAVVRDDQGTPMPGVDVEFELEGLDPVTATSNADGVAARTLTYTMPGHSVAPALSATMNVDGTQVGLSGSPVTMNFHLGLGCATTPTDLNWRLETSSQVTGLGIRMFLGATDADDEVARLDASKLTVTPSSIAVTSSTPRSRGDGSYVLSLLSSTPGDYTVTVSYDGTVYGAPVSFTYLEPAPSPSVPVSSDSYLFLSGWLVDPGEDVVATAVVVDEEGQGIQDVQVTLRASGSETFATTCTTRDDGRCSVTFSAPVAATITMSAYVGTQLIGSEQQVTFRPDIPQYTIVSMDIVEPSGSVRADGNDSYAARITLLNLDGTPVLSDNPFIDITFTVIDTDKNTLFPTLGRSVIRPEGGGVYSVYLTSTVPGTFIVYASSSYDYSDPVTLTFEEVPATEPGARLTLDCGELTNCTQILNQDPEAKAMVVVHDEQGLPEAGVKVDFVSQGSTLSARQCFTDDKGTCSIWVGLKGVGEHLISASIDGTSLEGSPRSVQVLNYVLAEPPLATLVSFTVTPQEDPVVADGVSAWLGRVTIESSDPYVWDYLLYIATFAVTPSNPSVSVGEIVDNGEGIFTMPFTSTGPGEFTVTSYFSGDAIEQTITFAETPPVPDPQQSSLTAASSLTDVDGNVVLTAMVKDTAGVAMKDVTVNFTTEAPGVLSEPTCTTESDGRCTVSVTSHEATTIHVSAFVNDQEISGSSLSIRFRSPSPSPSTTSASPSPSSTSAYPTQSVTSAFPTQSPTSASPTQSSTSPTTIPTSVGPTSTQSSTSPSPARTSASPSSSSSTSPTQIPTSGSPSQSVTFGPPTSGSPSQSVTFGPPTSGSPSQSVTSTPPTQSPTQGPTGSTHNPTQSPSSASSTSTNTATQTPTSGPTQTPTSGPTQTPTWPTQGPTESPTASPSSSGPTPSRVPRISLDQAALTLGQTLSISGENWVPGETVRVTMYSTEHLVGTETVNPDGTLPTMKVVIPTDLETGRHTIIAEGSVSDAVEVSFTVLASVPPSPTPVSSVPAAPTIATGGTALPSSVGWWVVIGLLTVGMRLILSRTSRQPRR